MTSIFSHFTALHRLRLPHGRVTLLMGACGEMD